MLDGNDLEALIRERYASMPVPAGSLERTLAKLREGGREEASGSLWNCMKNPTAPRARFF